MILALLVFLYGLASLLGLTDGINAAFSPVINSGSFVVAAAFVTALYTRRMIRAWRKARKQLKEETMTDDAHQKTTGLSAEENVTCQEKSAKYF